MVSPVTTPLPKTGPRQLPLELSHEPSLAEDDFLVGDGNALAHARILAWPVWPDGVTVLIGPPSSGKSHLARIFADRSGARVVTPLSIGEIASETGEGPLVVENVDSGEYDEPALFHLLNQAIRGERTLLLTARTQPSDWPLATEDVRSRIRRAAAFHLHVGGDIDLSHILVKLFGDRQLSVDPRVVAYLVPRMERIPEEAAALVDLMDRLALARGSAITRVIAAEALALRRTASDPGPQED